MIAAEHELRDAATAHATATLNLVDRLRTARAWQRERTPGSRSETAHGISDPTGELSASESRLALRARVIESLAAIDAATASFTHAATALTEALDRHQDPHAHLRQEVAA